VNARAKRQGAAAPTGAVTKSSISTRSAWRREKLLARWRLSTILAAAVAIAAVCAVLVTGLSLGGFGIPADSSPQVISSGAVPFGLLSRTSPPTAPPATDRKEHTQSEYLYFVGQNGRLVAVIVLIPRPVTIQAELNALFNGPGSAQTGGPANLLTGIPVGTSVLSATVSSSGLATLDLSSDIDNAFGEELIQAFAQMVYTITPSTACPPEQRNVHPKPPLPPTTATTAPHNSGGPPCVDKVAFQVEGVPQQVPIPDGAGTSEPVTRADYRSLS
jgi:Sporulation and spore germination